MGIFARLSSWWQGSPAGPRTSGALGTFGAAGGGRLTGEPPSGNGASSFHLRWELPGELVSVAATLEVSEAPTVERLYFWALQADFVEGGRRGGGAHLGLQFHPSYPGGRAANWGGYDQAGNILDGTASALASTLGNPHTRDFPWRAGQPYRLVIEAAPAADQPRDGRTAWRGSVTDLADGRRTVIRDLLTRGSRLVGPIMWSEVFARCEHPPAEVRWSDLRAVTAGGEELRPAAVFVNYQRHEDGGCANTCSWVDGDQLVQRTSTPRVTAQDSRLPLPI